jgi:hypothetical protein
MYREYTFSSGAWSLNSNLTDSWDKVFTSNSPGPHCAATYLSWDLGRESGRVEIGISPKTRKALVNGVGKLIMRSKMQDLMHSLATSTHTFGDAINHSQ